MKQLVVDAGPVIALFWSKDPDHGICKQGFDELSVAHTSVLIPIPITFEVYKWLLYRVSRPKALQALNAMDLSFHAVPISLMELEELRNLVYALDQWNGSLEDATIALTTQRYDCPLWTLNYKDLSVFSGLKFWIPS